MQFSELAARAAACAACAALSLGLGCSIERKLEPPEAPAIVLHTDSTSPLFGSIDVVRLRSRTLSALRRASPSAEEWEQVLSVRVPRVPDEDSVLPVLGNISIELDRLRFTPRFPPVKGQLYHVRLSGPALQRLANNAAAAGSQAIIDTTLLIQRPLLRGTTSVVRVFPTADTMPVNLLRLYVHFSASMSIGEAYQRVRLIDATGRKVEDAFLVVAGEKELWDPDHRRLTLLFDPGRIKRDLRPHEEAGLPLREGETFTLVIDSAWQDASGRPLVRRFEKRFAVTAADRKSPRIQDWRLSRPQAATRMPLDLEFPEPLDHALLERLVSVRRTNGSEVVGAATINQKETRWRFIPAAPWPTGSYYVEIGTDLEDLAGNNLRHLFDVDRKTDRRSTITAQRVTIPFVVR
ncbi:MAG: Ig-like domain-containing protein [Longimicrobiales bacterium]